MKPTIDIERILIEYHRARGDSKVRLHHELITPGGTLYLMRFYNQFGSCYSSIDEIDENGDVSEIARYHRCDERKMLDSAIGRNMYEIDR